VTNQRQGKFKQFRHDPMIPLTIRSHYSLMRGVNSIPEICHAARCLGYKQLALTDTDNLYGLWTFLTACKREGITPIVGAEITDPIHKTRAICLVESETGYRNLCRLITRRHRADGFQLKTAVPPYAGGLRILTDDPELLAFWFERELTIAAALPRKPVPPTHPLRKTAHRFGIPLVAIPDTYFLRRADAGIHRLLRAIDQNTELSRIDPGDLAPADAWLAPPEEYRQRFAACPEAIRATHEFAEPLTFTGPNFGVVLPPWQGPEGQSASVCLRNAAYEGAGDRYGEELAESVVERLEQELRIIIDMGFAGYFLVVQDIVKRSPRICGRGSAAASLVAYCLKITNVCPIKHNLYFERFLNPGRSDPPDIDVDFPWDERDSVLESVLSEYRNHAAMVSNHVCFKPRMAVREVAKVYGLPEGEIGKVTKRLPWYWHADEMQSDFMTWLKRRPETKVLDFVDPWTEILPLARRIMGAPRYLSVHPGGIVITPQPIDTYVPVEKAPKGVPVIQWEKDAAEEAGLVKIDLLGNRSLSVIRDALCNMRANGIHFDESRWEPEDDFLTQNMMAQGRTMGCFYIESPAMRLLQQKSAVGDFEHLVIHSSIIRPAANDYIQEYLRRLHGGGWEPIHPLLADVLEESFGIMIYQEDVSRAAIALAGFSHAEADSLRKVLSRKDREYRLRDFRDRFFTGARLRGVPGHKITEVWNMMMSFDGYSFCKPHSASYARVSFQAAFLKAHYPAEFMAAVISNQGGFYSSFAYVSEARRLGLSILPPDIHKSEIHWTGRGKTIRVGFLSIKGLSLETQARIITERHRSPYQSMKDFLNRVRPDESEARALIHAGALDTFCPKENRTSLLWELAEWHRRKENGPESGKLFRSSSPAAPPPLPRESDRSRLRREFAVLGFLCDRHPMTLFSEVLKAAETVKVAEIPGFPGRRVRVAAWLITGKVVHTKHGDLMEFLTFEDETGIIETAFFPETYRQFCHMIDRQRPYILTGKIERNWGATTLRVEKVETVPKPTS